MCPVEYTGIQRGIDDKEALELLATGWDKIGDTAMLHTSAHAVEPTRGLGPEAT